MDIEVAGRLMESVEAMLRDSVAEPSSRPLTEDQLYPAIIGALVFRSLLDLPVIRFAIFSGAVESASGLVRAFFEVAVTAAYIAAEPRTRARQFLQWGEWKRYRDSQIVRRLYPELDVREREAPPKGEWSLHWSKKSPAEMASEFGNPYAQWAHVADSNLFHCSPISVEQRFVLAGDELMVTRGPLEGNVGRLVTAACMWGMWLAETAASAFGVDLTSIESHVDSR